MAIKIVYEKAGEVIVDDIDEAEEDIEAQLADDGDRPIMVFDIANGVTYKCRWRVSLR